MSNYHSTYRGFDIFFRDDVKRRPWSVYLPQQDRYAAKATLEDCHRLIDRAAEAIANGGVHNDND